jgi:uncharacterized OB-fold protein
LTRLARLGAFVCARGHAYLHAQDACPQCGARLQARWIPPDATLTLDTTVRVTPDGDPFVLGIAVTRCGRARALCRVEGTIRGHGYDHVVLEKRGDVFVARRLSQRGR